MFCICVFICTHLKVFSNFPYELFDLQMWSLFPQISFPVLLLILISGFSPLLLKTLGRNFFFHLLRFVFRPNLWSCVGEYSMCVLKLMFILLLWAERSIDICLVCLAYSVLQVLYFFVDLLPSVLTIIEHGVLKSTNCYCCIVHFFSFVPSCFMFCGALLGIYVYDVYVFLTDCFTW